MSTTAHVVVIGGGNAALCAAISAAEHQASVTVLEAAPRAERGGNSYFTGGALRFAFDGIEDIRRMVPSLTDDELARVDIHALSAADLYMELASLSDYLADPDLVELLSDTSTEAMLWLAGHSVRFELSYGRHAQRRGDRFVFADGNPVELWGGGRELVAALYREAERLDIAVEYGCRALRIETDDEGITVHARHEGRPRLLRADAVILACGGFEANPEMRARYLGPDWDLARVRGTGYNVGDGIRMALEVGAQPFGHWSACHAVAWDANAPLVGDRSIGDLFQKHSYPYGIVVNRHGERFLDEGADFHARTYAKYGGEILRQPGRMAFQIFDQKVIGLLREEYRQPRATKYQADTLESLADQMGVDRDGLIDTVTAFNASISDAQFDPAELDGKCTVGIDQPKTNWALALDTPPYVAYAVTCGITFTFGGLRISENAEVLDVANEPIPGLYAAGELVGGLFYRNYPSGAGLVAGTVFGRIAGKRAASVLTR